MSLMRLKANAIERIAPKALFDGPILAALEQQGPMPGAGTCAFVIVEDIQEEAYTVDLNTAQIFAGIPVDVDCRLVLHATAFDALLRGKPFDEALSAHEGGAEIYGDPKMLAAVSLLLADGNPPFSSTGGAK